MNKSVKRGDIFYADLSPAIGKEQGGIRPVLVIQNDVGNCFSPTVIVAPIARRDIRKDHLPTHCFIEPGILKKDSKVKLEQIRTIDKTRLLSYEGALSKPVMQSIDKALATSVGL